MRRFGWLALVLGACVPDGSPDDLVLVAHTSSDPVRFEWNDEPVHTLKVGTCEGACTCDEGELEFDFLAGMWSVGAAHDDEGLPLWEEEPPVEPGVMYGQKLEGDQHLVDAPPLEPGVTYVAVIELWGCMHPEDPNDMCNSLVGSGCTLFSVE